MMNSQAIGLAIMALLRDVEGVTGIYPINATHDVAFPYISYQRISTEAEYSKDIHAYKDRVVVDIYVTSKESSGGYGESVEIAIDVRNRIERYCRQLSGINIIDCRLLDAVEMMPENGIYEQSMKFEFVIGRSKSDRGFNEGFNVGFG